MRFRGILALAAVIGFATAMSPPLAHADEQFHQSMQLGSSISGKVIEQQHFAGDATNMAAINHAKTILSNATIGDGWDGRTISKDMGLDKPWRSGENIIGDNLGSNHSILSMIASINSLEPALAKEGGSYLQPSLVRAQHSDEYLALLTESAEDLRQRMPIMSYNYAAGARSYPLRS
jgi:hypothetical protein